MIKKASLIMPGFIKEVGQKLFFNIEIDDVEQQPPIS